MFIKSIFIVVGIVCSWVWEFSEVGVVRWVIIWKVRFWVVGRSMVVSEVVLIG